MSFGQFGDVFWMSLRHGLKAMCAIKTISCESLLQVWWQLWSIKWSTWLNSHSWMIVQLCWSAIRWPRFVCHHVTIAPLNVATLSHSVPGKFCSCWFGQTIPQANNICAFQAQKCQPRAREAARARTHRASHIPASFSCNCSTAWLLAAWQLAGC